MLLEPGAIAEPMTEMTQVDVSRSFRAWKTSDADEISGPRTPYTSDRAVGIQF